MEDSGGDLGRSLGWWIGLRDRDEMYARQWGTSGRFEYRLGYGGEDGSFTPRSPPCARCCTTILSFSFLCFVWQPAGNVLVLLGPT